MAWTRWARLPRRIEAPPIRIWPLRRGMPDPLRRLLLATGQRIDDGGCWVWRQGRKRPAVVCGRSVGDRMRAMAMAVGGVGGRGRRRGRRAGEGDD